MNLFSELKRRNVFKVAAMYAVVGWLIVQLASTLTPAMLLPEWTVRLVTALLLLGFPIALILAWAFELTPEGIIKTEGEGKGKRGEYFVFGVLAIAVGFFIYNSQYTNGPSNSPVEIADQTSIAVLPFVNMSSDPEQEFFSDGITEEILNALVKVEGLKVTARTSAFAYKGQNRDMRKIGQELGVANLLEGSVRKSGTKIRITAQLINTSDGSHIWSEVYDRELTDIFSIQDEIAQSIAGTLALSLGIEEGQSLVEDRITDMALYEDFLKARRLIRNRTDEELWEAHNLLLNITEKEPEYAAGWAALSLSYNLIPFLPEEFIRQNMYNRATAQFEGEMAAKRAVSLNPNSAFAHHVLANAYRGRHQWAKAEDAYLLAIQLDPNSVEIIEDYGEFLQFVGKTKQMLEVAEFGLEMEPNAAFPYMRYLLALHNARDYEKFVEVYRGLENDAPLLGPGIILESFIKTGQYEAVREILENKFDDANKVFRLKFLEALENGESLEQFKGADEPSLYMNYLIEGEEGFLNLLEDEVYGQPFNHYMPLSMNFPQMDQVRQHYKFKRMVNFLGLVDYWRERGWPDYCRPLGDVDFECGAVQ